MSNIVVLSDRIKELSHTQGTSAFTLDGQLAGFSPFGDFYEYGDVIFYAATDGTRYEVGSGEYRQNGSNNELTRFPLRSSNLNSGPYYLNGKSASGGTRGQEGYYYPLYLTESAALAFAGATSAHTHTFSGYHGVTFYMPNNSVAHAQGSSASATGVDYAASGLPVNFPDAGIKEVYVTYPGKYSVFTGYGISGFQEPKNSGVAFWGSDQLLNYDSDMLWSDSRANLGISQTNPQFAIDVGGERSYSQIRASGFFGGGSGIYFSGGQALPQDATKTASGGRQLEPFFRNELDTTTGSNAVFYLSGIVNERICLLPQEKGTIFSGPASGCETAGCSPSVPTFRFLTLEDIPDLSTLYVVQDKEMNEDPVHLSSGAVALYNGSGVITYDDNFVFIKSTNKLGIGANDPLFALDVRGGNIGVSGNIFSSGDIYTNGKVEASGGLSAKGDAHFGNDVTVSGDLFVKGTTTYIDSTTVTIHDKQLELASLSGNQIHDDTDSLIDDGGILIRSSGDGAVDTGDKKWTWKNASNTWSATTSNGENLGITSSGIIFNAGMGTVSGAYKAGSGLTLLNNDLTFAVGNMFKVGAVASGQDGNDGNYIVNQIHQADEIGFSGIHGVAVNVSGEPFNAAAGGFASGIRIMIDPSGLSGLLYNEITHSGAAVSGLASTAIAAVSGALKYRIDNAGGYAGWKFHQPDVSIDTIGTNQLFTISGVSGIVTKYIPSTNNLIVSPDALSGVLTREINASGMKVSGAVVEVSGFALNYTNASGNFLLDSLNASGTNVSGLAKTAIAAVSGMFNHTINNLTTANLTAATLVTESDTIAGNDNDTTIPTCAAVKAAIDGGGLGGGGSYAGWRIQKQDTEAFDTIGSNGSVLFSGISGVNINYLPTSNTMLFDALALSGNLQYNIAVSGAAVSGFALNYTNASGNFLLDTINASGNKVSGAVVLNENLIMSSGDKLSVRASGLISSSGNFLLDTINASGMNVSGALQYAVNQATPNSAGSGLARVTEVDGTKTINMDIYGSGQLSHLIFNNDIIRIGKNAMSSQHNNMAQQSNDSIFIGKEAANSGLNNNLSIFLGNGAGFSASGNGGTNLIGHYAGSGSYELNYCNVLGYEAAGRANDCSHTVVIGKMAANGAVALYNNIAIGNNALVAASGDSLHDAQYNIALGHMTASGLTYSRFSNFLGADAGLGNSGIWHSTAIGYRASANSSGIFDSVMIGRSAGEGSYNLSQDIIIGPYAGVGIPSGTNDLGSSFPSHRGRNVIIGQKAGSSVSGVIGTDNVFIGTDAGSGTTHSAENIAIGRRAMMGFQGQTETTGFATENNIGIGFQTFTSASGLHNAIAIGYEAMANSSGYYANTSRKYSSDDIAIGIRAGMKSFNRGNNFYIGDQAGYKSSGLSSNVIMGTKAGAFSVINPGRTDSSYNIMIGDYAGFNSRNAYGNTYIGYYAGFEAKEGSSNNLYNVAIGPNAMYKASGDVSSIAIGRDAGMERNSVPTNHGSYNLQIGYQAGKLATGPYNTLIGHKAGYDQYLDRAIVIQHNNANAQCSDWVDSSNPEDYTVSLGRGFFQAYSEALTQIGAKPTDVSDFSSNILRVATHSASKTVLKTTRNAFQTGDQIQASLDSNDTANTIVNADGYLQLPIATSSTGSPGTTRQLFLATGQEVARVEGTVCVFKGGTTARLCVYVHGAWKRMPQYFQNF